MIKLVNGRWRSVKTEVESQEHIAELYKALKPEEKAVVDQILKEYGESANAPSLIKTAYEVEWDKTTGPPIPIRDWVNDEYYLGETAKTLYPTLKKDIIELFEGGYTECILTGCVDQDAIVSLSNGSLPRLGDLIGKTTKVLVTDSKTGLSHHDTTLGVDSGVKQVIKLTLKNGMEVKLTPDHKVLTGNRGWVPAEQLDVEKDLVVTPRRITYTPSCHDLTDAEVKLLAYWVTDGSIELKRNRARYCDGRIETVREVVDSLRALGMNGVEPYEKNGAWETRVRNFKTGGFHDWAIKRGLANKKTATVEIPDGVCRAPLDKIALFINRVWSAEGTVSAFNGEHQPTIQLGMKSERFIRQMQLLLLRFGIQSRIVETRGVRKGTPWMVYTLYISNKDNILAFIKNIGVIFAKEEETHAVLNMLEGHESAPVHDYLPLTIKDISTSTGVMLKTRNRQLTRKLLEDLAEQDPAFAEIKSNYSNDISFTPIKRKEVLNPIAVADIGVPGPHTFVANGLTVHNSIGW